MIRLADKSDLFYKPTASLVYISCLQKAFSGTRLQEDMWVQTQGVEKVGLIARNGGRLYVYSSGENTDELAEFLGVIGCESLLTEESAAKALGLKVTKEYNFLYRRSNGIFKKTEVSLKGLFSGLSSGLDGDIALPSFETFAPDISHRLRHGGAVAVINDFGAGLAFLGDGCAIISGIAVMAEHREKGYGSAILNELSGHINGDLFVLANEQNIPFYIKNGFKACGTAVIGEF